MSSALCVVILCVSETPRTGEAYRDNFESDGLRVLNRIRSGAYAQASSWLRDVLEGASPSRNDVLRSRNSL